MWIIRNILTTNYNMNQICTNKEHPPKRQQQAAAAKAPEITPFTS